MALSADELKTHIYNRFEKQGLIDDLKAGLRTYLLTELSKISSCDEKPEAEFKSLPAMISNWLIANHLEKFGFEWTTSTFKAETDSKSKAGGKGLSFQSMSSEEVLQILNFDVATDCGILYEIVTRICEQMIILKSPTGKPGKCECKINDSKELQPSYTHDGWINDMLKVGFKLRNSLTSLYDEFLKSDLNYEILDVLRNSKPLVFPERGSKDLNLEAYNRFLQGSLRKAVSATLEKVRRMQFEVMEAEKEAQTSGIQMYGKLDVNNILESEVCLRKWGETIQQRVAALYDDIHRQRIYSEEEILNQRQCLLNDIDVMKSRENDLRQKTVEFESEFKNKKNEFEQRLNELQIKEKHYNRMSANLENVIADRVEKYKKEFEQALSVRLQNIEKREQNVKSEFLRLEACKNGVESVYQKVFPSVKSASELESKFMEENRKITNRLMEISDRQEKIQNMSENQQLKAEFNTLRQEISTFKTQVFAIPEVEKEEECIVSELNSRKRTKVSEAILTLKKDIEKLKRQRNDVEHMLREEIRVIKTQVDSQEQQLVKSKYMNKDAFNQQSSSRYNEIKDHIVQNPATPEIFKQISVNRFNTESHSHFPHPSDLKFQMQPQLLSSRPVIDESFINQTKLRIKALELEANNLSSTYKLQKERSSPIRPHLPLSSEPEFKHLQNDSNPIPRNYDDVIKRLDVARSNIVLPQAKFDTPSVFDCHPGDEKVGVSLLMSKENEHRSLTKQTSPVYRALIQNNSEAALNERDVPRDKHESGDVNSASKPAQDHPAKKRLEFDLTPVILSKRGNRDILFDKEKISSSEEPDNFERGEISIGGCLEKELKPKFGEIDGVSKLENVTIPRSDIRNVMLKPIQSVDRARNSAAPKLDKNFTEDSVIENQKICNITESHQNVELMLPDKQNMVQDTSSKENPNSIVSQIKLDDSMLEVGLKGSDIVRPMISNMIHKTNEIADQSSQKVEAVDKVFGTGNAIVEKESLSAATQSLSSLHVSAGNLSAAVASQDSAEEFSW